MHIYAKLLSYFGELISKHNFRSPNYFLVTKQKLIEDFLLQRTGSIF